ncbi:PAAR domain-containing protein [Cupriavidus basilensis]|uniref:PAAR domain-containing protein n=2 Tax=Cupriavidus basilensis TaxID=68895 RepID=UPI0034583F63
MEGSTMMRRIACVGDVLARGGKILPYAGPVCTFGDPGHQAALIGGQAYCETCKSTGTIAKSGGPRRMQFMGEIALDGDIVLCQCPTPPRIVALVAGENWFEDMGARDGADELPGSGHAGFTATRGPVSESFDELVIAVSASGPIADYPYFVETTDGRGLFGHTDAQGRLPRIATTDSGLLTVYWGDEALAKHLGDEDG